MANIGGGFFTPEPGTNYISNVNAQQPVYGGGQGYTSAPASNTGNSAIYQNGQFAGVSAPSGGSVTPTPNVAPQGSSSNTGGGGGGGGGGGNNYQQQWEAAGHAGIAPVGYHGEAPINAYGQTAAQVAAAQSAYDQAVQTLQGFVPILQNQAQTSTGAVNQSVQDTINQAQTGETNLSNQAQSATNQANQSLKTNLGGNNAYAASFGSGLSSFGEGLNNQAYQNFGNTTGGIQNNLQSGLQNLENQKVSAQNWGQNQVSGIQNQLQQGLQQIALNVNQTDIQKANAVTQIQQQAQQQMNAINSIVAQLQANIEQARQQNLTYAAQYAGTYPQLSQNIQNLANTFAGQGNVNVNTALPGNQGIYGSEALNRLYGSNTPQGQ